MPENQTDLAATISARICHDLISPIGAISNGLELLTLAGGPASPEMALISETVRCANAKVRFLRIAFGSPRAGTTVSASEINGILTDAYSDPRIKIRWTIPSPMKRPDVQILFLLILCAEKIAPYSAVITVHEGERGFAMLLTGKPLKPEGFLDFNHHRLLQQSGPSLVQFNLAEAQMTRIGYPLDLAQSDGEIRFSIQT